MDWRRWVVGVGERARRRVVVRVREDSSSLSSVELGVGVEEEGVEEEGMEEEVVEEEGMEEEELISLSLSSALFPAS